MTPEKLLKEWLEALTLVSLALVVIAPNGITVILFALMIMGLLTHWGSHDRT